MLSIPNKLLKYLRAAQSKLVAIVSFVKETLNDEQSTLADWQAGGLGGVAGVDYPATALTAPVATADVVINVASTAGFTVGDTGANVGYLVLWDGTFREIISYTGSTATTFTGLVRGLYGTSPRAYAIADFVLQITPGLGTAPEYNLTVNKKNYVQSVAAGGPPVARIGASMVFSPVTGLYYLFGGYDGAVFKNDLWSFNPSTDTWALLVPIGGPPAIRADHVMVYNSIDDELWVFGGHNVGGNLLDTWKYNIAANTWTTNALWNHPLFVAGYTGASGVYIESTAAVGGAYIFGGDTGGALRRAECYYFDGLAFGVVWYLCTSMPFGIAYGAATYLEFIDKVLYVGTQANNLTQITYLWKPTTLLSYWDNTTPAPLPVLRRVCTIVYDPLNRRALLFGGEGTPGGAGFNNLYSYDSLNNTWTKLCDYTREARTHHVAALDTASNEMVIWGGLVTHVGPVWPAYVDPIRYRAYWVSAKYYTDTMDMGEVPVDPGEWILEDITDTTYGHTVIEYRGEWSLTGVGGWNNIGVIHDGDEIAVLSRYWRVYVDMQNDGFDLAARVTLIDANYDKLLNLCMAGESIGDYPPLVKSVSTLSSKVDVQTCKGSIGTMRIELIRSGMQTDQILMNAFPKRKSVKVKLGVLEDDIDIPDFHMVLRARADDWSASRTQIVFELADYIDEVKQDIPQEDLSGIVIPLDYQVGGIATNPIDIILDILQNQINLPDRDLDLDSFRVVRDDTSLSGWQFKREFCCPEDASKILEDLCRHIGAALVPRENGKISLILFNPDNDAVMIWNELDQAFKNEKFMGKASSIRNYISTWWDWDGDGEDVADWGGIEVAIDATSITRHGNKILRTKSKWLGRALPPPNPPYAGDVIALAISDRILDMSKVGLQEVSLSTNMSAFEAQVGDLISVQSSVIRDNTEYQAWQRDNDGERDKLIMDILEPCEDAAKWTRLWAAGNEVLNPGVSCYGNGSLDLIKDNTGGVLQQSGYTTAALSLDLTSYDIVGLKFFITDPTILRAATAVQVEFRTGAPNRFHKLYDAADLVSGWNFLGGEKDSFTLTGAGDWANITRLRLYFWTPVAADLIPLGDIKMDCWHGYRWQRPADSHGRYSLPYINYGTNECVDLKWWIKSKSVNFAKGTINWGLVRARQIPLDAEYTSQDDWYNAAHGENIDLETTPGSVLISINAGPNYYQSAYGEINIDLGQQPEQDGTYTIEDTIPIGTAISYEAWSSETGAWQGEENYMGFIVDGDTVEIKARYYKVRGTLFSDTALLLTPSIDRILLRFDLG